MLYNTDDLRIKDLKELLPPIALLERFPISDISSATVSAGRAAIQSILENDDDRLLVVAGPCSIHDTEAAIEYAERLTKLREQYAADLEVVMRVYFEKPRTTLGWKGLINDPFLDGSHRINDGLRMARKLLCDINSMGLPAAGEFLDTISPQYIADLMAWGAIGARTTESQCHRQLASGLSCPVGFKNGTDGNINIAVDAIKAAAGNHQFLSVTKFGHAAIVETTGNSHCHLILRGGNGQPNYDAASIAQAESQLKEAGLAHKIMVDLSHANSNKDYRNQKLVAKSVCDQIAEGNSSIFGVMIESHLNEGSQKLVPGKTLEYGKSITDACVGWDETETLLGSLAGAVRERRERLL